MEEIIASSIKMSIEIVIDEKTVSRQVNQKLLRREVRESEREILFEHVAEQMSKSLIEKVFCFADKNQGTFIAHVVVVAFLKENQPQ